MGYWKSKVLPAINKVFKKDPAKKTAAAEACKSFDESKEEINKEFEEKKGELEPKVVEIYEASSTEIKALVKDPKDSGLKKHSTLVQKFLEELVKIEFPGSKAVAEASSKFGANYVSGPVVFIFEKVSSFIVVPVVEKEAAVEEGDKKQPEPEAETAQVLEEEPPAKVEEAAQPSKA
ncbi:plasma membrane-associated cation-binding protein 1 [Euphorbia lathyris]|uniref:plasma membrane-associated cation-binding protein 1 n=1 Tax=Euphorbia lathyris TaxID=212925 RepID=UPI0033134265